MEILKTVLTNKFENSYDLERINKFGALLNSKSNSTSFIFLDWSFVGFSVAINSIIGLKSYKEIDIIMNQIIKESEIQINYFGDKNCTVNIFKKFNSIEVDYKNQSELIAQIDLIESVIIKDIIPIFDKIEGLKELHDYIEQLNEKELSEFLTNPVLLRKLLIRSQVERIPNLEEEINLIKNQIY